MTNEQPLSDAADAIEEVVYRFSMYVSQTSDMVNEAHHLLKLADAVGDLRSYHPEYDEDTGMLPYEREDAEYDRAG